MLVSPRVVSWKDKCVSRKRVICVTLGIMLSLFLASMESTVVSTAMPTIAHAAGRHGVL